MLISNFDNFMNCSWSKVENIKLGKFGFLRVHQVAAFVCSVTQLDTSEAQMLRIWKLSKYISDALISRNWANSVWVNWKKKLETKMSMSFEIFQIKYLFENKTWCILLCSFRGILFATSLGLFLWCHWRTEKVCAT